MAISIYDLRSKMLTQALLHASDPWFCQQKHTSLVDVLMPRNPSRQNTGAVAALPNMYSPEPRQRAEADGQETSETEDSSSESESE